MIFQHAWRACALSQRDFLRTKRNERADKSDGGDAHSLILDQSGRSVIRNTFRATFRERVLRSAAATASKFAARYIKDHTFTLLPAARRARHKATSIHGNHAKSRCYPHSSARLLRRLEQRRSGRRRWG